MSFIIEDNIEYGLADIEQPYSSAFVKYAEYKDFLQKNKETCIHENNFMETILNN